MAFIRYVDSGSIPADERVDDDDNIIRIHGVHPRMIRRHHDLYREVMYGAGPLSRVQREIIGVVVSARNDCEY